MVFIFQIFRTIIAFIMKQAPKSVTIMKYLGIDGEHHFIIMDDLQFPNLEDRLEYLSKLEYNLWANGEIVEHLWTRTSTSCKVIL